MNEIEHLQGRIRAAYPNATLNLTPPLRSGGIWSLDLDLADKHLAIEWSDSTGFGVSSVNNDNFGERPDEAFKSVESTVQRIRQLLTGQDQTSPPFGVLLSRLRERRGLTQQTLASKLGIRQSSVSGIERREDVQLSTLRRVIDALGGTLEVSAIFSDARYRLILGVSEESPQPPVTSRLADLQATDSVAYEDAFIALRNSGELRRATEVANHICSRHAIIEMV